MAGVGTLIRLILRRDRLKLPLWIGGFLLTLLSMIPLLRDVYGDEESLATVYATFSANPAGMFMTGPMDEPTFGAFMMIETLLWWGMAIAFLNTLLIVRHTRHNEEIGAQELLLSGQVHRASSLVAAVVVALAVNALIVLGLGFGMQVMDAPWSAEHSWLYGLAMGGFGFVWAGVAAVVVQLVESGRSANATLAALIGLGFLVRGIGDFMGSPGADGLHQPEWISALSPFGWLQATRPLISSYEWWPLLIAAGFAAAMVGLGFVLLARRDVGAGILPSRAGKARASRLLGSSLGLTLYLQKNIFIGWLAAVLVMVATIGALVPQMGDIYSSSDSMRQMIESIGGTGALIPSFMSAMIAINCLLVFAYAVHGLSRLRGEEASGRLESLIATKLSRLKWLGLHAAVVMVGGLIMLIATGAVLAVCINLLSDFHADVWEYTLAGLSYAPIMLVFMALYILLFGLLPRASGGLAWLYFGFVAFALWLGPIVQLDQAVMNISVMNHVATPPAEDIALRPLLVITLVAAAGLSVGLAAFRDRDLKC